MVVAFHKDITEVMIFPSNTQQEGNKYIFHKMSVTCMHTSTLSTSPCTLPSFLQVHGSFWAANESAALEVFCGGAEGEWAGERLQ